MDIENLVKNDRWMYFQKGEFPALFYLQVEEGMAKVEVPDRANLEILLRFAASKGYQVEWTQAVPDHPDYTEELQGFPGGRFVAHWVPDSALPWNAAASQARTEVVQTGS